MEARAAFSLQSCSWIGCEKAGRKSGGFLRFSRGCGEEKRFQTLDLRELRPRVALVRSRHLESKVSCCYKKAGGKFIEENCL